MRFPRMLYLESSRPQANSVQTCVTTGSSTWIVLNLIHRLLVRQDVLLSHGRHHSDDELLLLVNHVFDTSTDLVIRAFEIILSAAVVQHEGAKALVVDGEKLIICSVHDRRGHIVAGRTDVLLLRVGEYVKSNHMHLSVSVLARLGGRGLNHLAGAVLDVTSHDGDGEGGTGPHLLEFFH